MNGLSFGHDYCFGFVAFLLLNVFGSHDIIILPLPQKVSSYFFAVEVEEHVCTDASPNLQVV